MIVSLLHCGRRRFNDFVCTLLERSGTGYYALNETNLPIGADSKDVSYFHAQVDWSSTTQTTLSTVKLCYLC